MEDVHQLEIIAKESANLVQYEKELAKTSIEASKLEIKRTMNLKIGLTLLMK